MMSLASPTTGSVNQKQSTNRAKATKKRVADLSGIGGKAQRTMQSMEQNIWLPDSPATFAFYIIAIAVLCGGLFLHINLSAQITRTQYDMAETQRNFYEVERESAEIVSQIALATSMVDIYRRAQALGYVPVTDKSKNFVAAADIRVQLPTIASGTNASIASTPAAGNSVTGEITNITGITVAEALETQETIAVGSSELRSDNALALGINEADLFAAGNESDSGSNLAEENQSGGFTMQLIKWWMSD